MNVLAIDTSGQALGLCLQTADHRLYTVNHQIGLRHTQTTMVWIDRLLSDAAMAPVDLDLVVSCSGPGSFTGVRIGMATAKGLAMAAACPLVAITSLDSLAHRYAAFPGIVVPVIDARKSRYYAAIYRDGSRVSDYLDAEPSDLASHFTREDPVLLTGPDARAVAEELPATEATVVVDQNPTASEPVLLLLLGLARHASHGPDREPVEPSYIRHSDAELARGKK